MTKIFIVVTILGIDFENTNYWCTFMVFSVRHANGGFQIAFSTTLRRPTRTHSTYKSKSILFCQAWQCTAAVHSRQFIIFMIAPFLVFWVIRLSSEPYLAKHSLFVSPCLNSGDFNLLNFDPVIKEFTCVGKCIRLANSVVKSWNHVVGELLTRGSDLIRSEYLKHSELLIIIIKISIKKRSLLVVWWGS